MIFLKVSTYTTSESSLRSPLVTLSGFKLHFTCKGSSKKMVRATQHFAISAAVREKTWSFNLNQIPNTQKAPTGAHAQQYAAL